jgi:hypothetical protein
MSILNFFFKGGSNSTLALYIGYATLAALLPLCGKGTFGMRLIFALSAQKSSAFLKVSL